MRRIIAALAALVVATSLASCQWMTEMTLEDAATPTLVETAAPASTEPEATKPPDGGEMPGGSTVPELSPSIEIPPPTD